MVTVHNTDDNIKLLNFCIDNHSKFLDLGIPWDYIERGSKLIVWIL